MWFPFAPVYKSTSTSKPYPEVDGCKLCNLWSNTPQTHLLLLPFAQYVLLSPSAGFQENYHYRKYVCFFPGEFSKWRVLVELRPCKAVCLGRGVLAESGPGIHSRWGTTSQLVNSGSPKKKLPRPETPLGPPDLSYWPISGNVNLTFHGCFFIQNKGGRWSEASK